MADLNWPAFNPINHLLNQTWNYIREGFRVLLRKTTSYRNYNERNVFISGDILEALFWTICTPYSSSYAPLILISFWHLFSTFLCIFPFLWLQLLLCNAKFFTFGAPCTCYFYFMWQKTLKHSSCKKCSYFAEKKYALIPLTFYFPATSMWFSDPYSHSLGIPFWLHWQTLINFSAGNSPLKLGT